MSDKPFIRTEINGPVATIIVDRPDKRNALDGPAARALTKALRAFDNDDDLSVAVLYGEGGHFCAGADLTAFDEPERRNDIDPNGGPAGPMGPTRMMLMKPLIAAVSGYAVAGGLELALIADMRVAEDNAVFGAFSRKLGVPLIDGGTVRLPRLVGMGRALDLILTGRPVGAQEALLIGLVNRVVAKGEARREAEKLAAELAALPQLALQYDRLSAYRQWFLPLSEALREEGRLGGPVLASEIAEGARHFKEDGHHHEHDG